MEVDVDDAYAIGEAGDVDVDVEVEASDEGYGSGFTARGRTSATRFGGWREDGVGGDGETLEAKIRATKIEEEWDGMDMEMEM